MDAFLVIPCIVVIHLFRASPGILPASSFVLGTIPGLVLLTYTNHIKFGVLSPLSYGDSNVGFLGTLPFGGIVAIITLTLVLWVLTRPSIEEELRSGLGRKYLVMLTAFILTILALASLFLPEQCAVLKRTIGTCYEAVVDIRAIDPGSSFPSMERSRSGGVIYLDAHKKALLQSLPYLVILVIPLADLIRKRAERFRLSATFIIPAAFIALHSYLISEHGGLCLNYRYFLPLLPFTSILCAYAWAKLNEDWHRPPGHVALGVVTVATAAGFAGFRRFSATLEALEFPLLSLPHLMALLILGLIIAGYAAKTDKLSPLRIACMITIVAAMTWSGLTAFFYDYSIHREIRLNNFITDKNVLSKVSTDSLFISTPYLGPSLIQGDRIRIAFPAMDEGKDTSKLIAFHLAAGRRVFWVFSPQLIDRMLKPERLDYLLKPMLILSGGRDALVEIGPAPNKPKDRRLDEDSSGR